MNDPKLDLDDVIDRIVDGGLSPRELRAAVASLDASPGHWRRCALAFVEARTLGEVLRDMDETRPLSREVIPFRRDAINARRLAYAASLAMLAFGLGWLGAGATGNESSSTSGRVGRSEARPTDAKASPVGGPRFASTHPTKPLGAGLPTPPEPPTEIPLEDWLRDQPPPISSYEQAALEREGYRVEQRREVVLGTLDDGRLAALPVDQVQVEYVGHLPL